MKATTYEVMEITSKKLLCVAPELACYCFGGYTRDDIKDAYYHSRQPFTVKGFLEKSQGGRLFYSSAFLIDYPLVRFVRKEKAWKRDYFIEDANTPPEIIPTSLGNLVVLLCYDAYRYSHNLEFFDALGQPIDFIIIPSDWRRNFQLLETAARKLSRALNCSVIVADTKNGLRIHNGMLATLKFKEVAIDESKIGQGSTASSQSSGQV